MLLGSESKGLDSDPSDIHSDVRLTLDKASLDTVSSETYVQNRNINTTSFVFYFVMSSCLVSYSQNGQAILPSLTTAVALQAWISGLIFCMVLVILSR